MGSMLRSEPMTLCDIYVQPEAAFEILSQLGEMGCVQFLDMNPELQAFQRNYISEVRRCAEMERKLRYMESEMNKDNIYIPDLVKKPKAMQPNEMIIFENILDKWVGDIKEMSANQTSLMKNYLETMEMYYVLNHIGPILGDAEIRRETILPRKGGELGSEGRLVVMTGVVRRTRSYPFEMMLWRVSRGNIYYRQANEDQILKDPYTGRDVRKVAFLAVCQGEQLRTRMNKICSGFRANVYPCPKTLAERQEMLQNLEINVSDLQQVLKKSKYHYCKAMRTVARQWRTWIVQVRKAKAIYYTMNLFNLDITKKCLIGQCWVPDNDLRRTHDVLEHCSEIIGTNVPSFMSRTDTKSVPPTFHRTNKFTKGFQALIKAYGDSTYRELNPGLYTIITFPFLFALMFGDFGHGLIILCFSVWMIRSERKYMGKHSSNEIWNIFFGGRYVILLMSVFTMFTGIIYNDYFSRSIILRDSHWRNTLTIEELSKNFSHPLNPLDSSKPYLIGLDPMWMLSKNKIIMENSIKMKFSIIIGVIHMMFGLCLSLCNHIYFKRKHAIFLEFIPQFLFMCCLFLWLVILIYYKWWNYSGKSKNPKRGSGCAPLILILFIDMVLMSTTKPVNSDCDAYMFPAQQEIQFSLVIIALLCVPIMLLGSPLYIHRYNKKMKEEAVKKMKHFQMYADQDVDKKLEESIMAEVAMYSKPFSELIIYQSIHTIEFVLSTISHTASYLRLWALSLAHAQLSEMLWIMVFSKMALQSHSIHGAPKVFIVFAIWAGFTLAILVLMEGLSAFLHTLRLHWVEFMSKFYTGGGYVFTPFYFDDMLSHQERTEEKSSNNTNDRDVERNED